MSDKETHASAPAASSRLYDSHFAMVDSKDAQPNMNCLSAMLLGLRDTTLSCKKGIKVGPGEAFCYGNRAKSEMNKKGSLLYIYEAGLHPEHAKTLEHCIKIYVTRNGEGTVLVGILSAARPRIQLELTLGEDCQLKHTAARKSVLFNGFCLTLAKSPKLVDDKSKLLADRKVWRRAKSVTLEADKELWVVEVHPSENININPVDDGKEYHLLEVYSRENRNENISLDVGCNSRVQSVGELVPGCNRTRLNLVFDDVVTLSHTSNITSVFFSGYTVPKQSFEFKLKELNKYTGDPGKDSLKSPKISLDPEYLLYKASLLNVTTGTRKQQPTGTPEARLLKVTTVTPKEQPSGTLKQQPAGTPEARLRKMTTGTPKQQPTGIPKRPEVNLASLSALTAPLIFAHRASCELFSASPRGLFWVPKQESDVLSPSNKLSTSKNSSNKVVHGHKVFHGTQPPETSRRNKHMSSKLLSPFNCPPNKGVSDIPIDRALALRDTVISDPSLMDVTLISNASLGVCSRGTDLASSFKDNASTLIEIMQFFTECIRKDDNLLAPECRGYRLFLSWELGSLLNCEELVPGQVYDSSTAAAYLSKHLNDVDPKEIKMEKENQYRAEDLFYLIFHDLNEIRPLPDSLEKFRPVMTIEGDHTIIEEDDTISEKITTSSKEDASDEEEKTTSKKPEDGKKRVAETPLKAPASNKKAKIAKPSGQTTGDNIFSHVATTPHPAKQARKAPRNNNNNNSKLKFPKSVSTHACKSCSRAFGSDSALQSHEKAKHA